MFESQFERYFRRAVKGAWWLATPWRLPQRMQFLRERAVARALTEEFAPFLEREQRRAALRQCGAAVTPEEAPDLFDDAAVARIAGLPWAEISWTPPEMAEVADSWSATRFLLDLWRRDPGLRARFPAALSPEGRDEFGEWIRRQGAAELGLSASAAQHLLDALAARPSDRARQAFLSNELLKSVLPHGLTPAGMAGLLRWFMRIGLKEYELRLEEVWWLFLEAAQDPRRELHLAHAFAPEWQKAHQDGLTVFGREAFASWFAAEYGASGAWLETDNWPDWDTPALQIRIAYWTRAHWRTTHPRALADAQGARALLGWLVSSDAGLSATARAWCRQLELQVVCDDLAGLGANVIGHFCYPSGLRVSAESMVRAMGLAKVSTSLRDVRTDAKDDPHHVDFRGMECHDVTIIHTQPQPFFDDAYSRADVLERTPRTYRIGYWYWEFDSIPDSWVEHAKKVDEVWAATEFVARGLRARLSIPVRTLFPGVKLAPYERRDKSYFGLSEKPFTFLFIFHMMSVMERKNPLGLIRAFKEAFRDNEDVRLVLKTSFGDRHPVQFEELRSAAGDANVMLIDKVYNPDEVLSLMDACDAYVSLHRSEGLGLTMAEAMLMGKPVIATNFSGNTDFMNEDNSLLVPYELVKLGEPIPPYDADLEWAEPSIEHAAQFMRRVYEDRDWARELGARAKASAEANLSLEAAGGKIAGRLAEIRALRRGAPSQG